MRACRKVFIWLLLSEALALSSSSLASQTPLVLEQQGAQCVTNKRIAIVGAGAAGTSAAFWLAKAQQRYGLDVEVDVFDKNNYVGGRTTVVWPYDDSSLEPVELGGAVFVQANKVLWRAVDEYHLQRIRFEDENAVIGLWDGQEFRLTIGGAGFYSGFLDTLKVVWRYGINAPRKTQKLVKERMDSILPLYSPSPPVWDSISSLVAKLGWSDVTSHTALEYLRSQNVSDVWSSEFVECPTRLNYGQDIDRIHALGGLVSLAAEGASTVMGGIFQILENFLRESNASVFLNSEVKSATRASSETPWELTVQTAGGTVETRSYGTVILAAPMHQAGIAFHSEPAIAKVPEQPYVHLHVTILATSSPSANASYFNLPPGSHVPDMVLTTRDGARRGGAEPEFNSLSYLRAVRRRDGGVWKNARGEPEWVVKVFSRERISDDWLDSVFDGKVHWVVRKEWDPYPVLGPTEEFPPVKLGNGVYYVNAFEPLISTLETEIVSSRNVVELLLREKFNAALCKPPTSVAEGERRATDDNFVYGWDC